MVKDGTEQSLSMAEKLAGDNGHDSVAAGTWLISLPFPCPFLLLSPTVFPDEMRPHSNHDRPKTTAMVARRMVSNALGVRVQLSPGQREKERKELREARGEEECSASSLSYLIPPPSLPPSSSSSSFSHFRKESWQTKPLAS